MIGWKLLTDGFSWYFEDVLIHNLTTYIPCTLKAHGIISFLYYSSSWQYALSWPTAVIMINGEKWWVPSSVIIIILLVQRMASKSILPLHNVREDELTKYCCNDNNLTIYKFYLTLVLTWWEGFVKLVWVMTSSWYVMKPSCHSPTPPAPLTAHGID